MVLVATLNPTAIIVSDNQIVPNEYQHMLIAWRDAFKMGYFGIGDIANQLLVRAAQQGFHVSQARVFSAVGRFCDKSGNTVRYYADIAGFYPPEVRTDYEMLPFSHFAVAKMAGEKWQDVLEYSKLKPHCAEEELRARLLFLTNNVAIVTTTEENGERVQSDGDGVQADSVPGSLSGSHEQVQPVRFYRALLHLGELVDVVQGVLDNVKLDIGLQSKLASALKTIRDALPEIVRSIER